MAEEFRRSHYRRQGNAGMYGREDVFVSLKGKPETISIPTGVFGVSSHDLVSMSKDNDGSFLQRNGGVKDLAEKLKSTVEDGISGDEVDIASRNSSFGSNTYPRKKGKGFLSFFWDDRRNMTLLTVMFCGGYPSLLLGINAEGIREGWYDGGGIALAVFIVILFTAISDYKLSLQFQKLNEEKQNIQLEVVR